MILVGGGFAFAEKGGGERWLGGGIRWEAFLRETWKGREGKRNGFAGVFFACNIFYVLVLIENDTRSGRTVSKRSGSAFARVSPPLMQRRLSSRMISTRSGDGSKEVWFRCKFFFSSIWCRA